MAEGASRETDPTESNKEHPFLTGPIGEVLSAVDWATTPLGEIDTWPIHLKTMVATILRARHPMLLWWGEELIQFYNDAVVPSLGVGKHPSGLGQRARESWAEVWPVVGHQLERVAARGESFWSEDALVPIFRNGRIEEAHWTYGYSPVIDDRGAIAGVLTVCNETTSRVVAERRLEIIKQLVDKTAARSDVLSVMAAAQQVVDTATYDKEFPFPSLLSQGIVRDELSAEPSKPTRGIVIDDRFHPIAEGVATNQLFCLSLPFLLGRHPFIQGITSSHEMGAVVGGELAAAIGRATHVPIPDRESAE